MNPLQTLGSYDVVVVGSGSAGSTAAIAAARGGAQTLLIEKLPFLGGVSTAVLDTFYGFYTPGSRATKVVGGIADDVVAGLRQLGPVLERPNTYGAGTGVTYLAEHLKVVWEQLVTDAGATVLLHAFVQDATVIDGRIAELLVATKAGLHTVSAKVVIDTSGDADVCHHAGIGYEMAGSLAPAQTLTTTFRMANVDMAARSQLTKEQLHALMAVAADSGKYELPRREGSDHITPVDGMVATVMTRLDHVTGSGADLRNASDPEILTRAEMAGRRQALEYVRFLRDKVPGYEAAALIALSSQVGVRETRRVYGEYRITRDDVLAARQFDDQIGLCGAPIEDHHGGTGTGTTWEYLPDGEVVGIPLRTLIARDGQNVLMAGRCFSAEHDAQASIRSMAQCMAMGQAVGTVAALAAAGAGLVRSVPYGAVADELHATGAITDLDRRGMIVRTVLGDVDPATLGVTYMHEHVILDSPLIADQMAHIHLPSVDEAVAELEHVSAAGGRTVVDAMPCAGGRRPNRLAEVSRRSGVNIIATTGLHTTKYYASHRWALDADVADMTKLFVADINEGIDEFDYTGPVVRRSSAKAGIIKVATMPAPPTERDRRLFQAAVNTHHATGAPILTHCEAGAGALDQIEMFQGLDMDLSRVVMSHTDKVADPRYHDAILSSGVNLEYDQALRQPPDAEMGTAWLLAEMIRDGFSDQIMLGTDGARRSLWTSLGGSPGLAYLYDGFVDVLAGHGIDEPTIEKLFVANPARLLAFAPKDQP